MRSRHLAAAVAALVATAAVAVPAALAGPPAFDKAEGAGTFLFINPSNPNIQQERSFTLSAMQQGFGERATGTWTQQVLVGGAAPYPRFVGNVTCMNVFANTASIGGWASIATPQMPNGSSPIPFVVWVVDNGPEGSNPPDLYSFGVFGTGDPDLPLLPPGLPNVCPPPFLSLYGYFPLDSGNIVVEDESPPAVSP